MDDLKKFKNSYISSDSYDRSSLERSSSQLSIELERIDIRVDQKVKVCVVKIE